MSFEPFTINVETLPQAISLWHRLNFSGVGDVAAYDDYPGGWVALHNEVDAQPNSGKSDLWSQVARALEGMDIEPECARLKDIQATPIRVAGYRVRLIDHDRAKVGCAEVSFEEVEAVYSAMKKRREP